MQNVFHKLAIAAVLSLGLSSGLMANDDLLALATNGEVTTASVEAVTTTEAIKLSDAQMSDVRGGIYYYSSPKSAIYANAFMRSYTLSRLTPMQRIAALMRVN